MTGSITPSLLTADEIAQVERANETGKQPVMFVHGLWLLPSSWARWAELFENAGYTAITPGWPGDLDTVAEANENPEAVAGVTILQVADHLATVGSSLTRKPAIVGHSFGGLLAEILAGRGMSVATVAIAPAAFRGVLPLPWSALKSALPVLGNPGNRSKGVPLTFDQFRYAFANAVSEDEAKDLYENYAVPAPGAPLFQAAFANLNPWTEDIVDVVNPQRGPLLIISGENDHTVPDIVAQEAYKRQLRNSAVTERLEVTRRGHSLTIDSGWQEVAEKVLAFVKRFAASSML